MINDMCIVINIHNITQPQLFSELSSLTSYARAAVTRCALEEIFFISKKYKHESKPAVLTFNLKHDEILNLSYRLKINAKTHSEIFKQMQTHNKNTRSALIVYALRSYYNINDFTVIQQTQNTTKPLPKDNVSSVESNMNDLTLSEDEPDIDSIYQLIS